VRLRFAAAAHRAAALRVDFDFVVQVGLVEERLRNPNAPRVPIFTIRVLVVM
jgi:hypothetical protein